jgi:hypothetical protein
MRKIAPCVRWTLFDRESWRPCTVLWRDIWPLRREILASSKLKVTREWFSQAWRAFHSDSSTPTVQELRMWQLRYTCHRYYNAVWRGSFEELRMWQLWCIRHRYRHALWRGPGDGWQILPHICIHTYIPYINDIQEKKHAYGGYMNKSSPHTCARLPNAAVVSGW